jgi:hypothetical protein
MNATILRPDFTPKAADTGPSRCEIALALAADDFWIFPLKAGGRTPAHKGWQQEASRDPDTIRGWFEGTNYNIGIYTGRFGDRRSDGGYDALVVVDVDNKNGKHGDAALLRLELLDGLDVPPTRTTITASGGRHLFYQHHQAVKQGTNVLGAGLDIRSNGGYAVAPGSTIGEAVYAVSDGREIATAPAWLIEQCGRKPERQPDAGAKLPGIDPTQAEQRAIEYLADLPVAREGGRNNACYKAAAKVRGIGNDRDVTLALMLEYWQCEPMLEAEEITTTVDSAYKCAQNAQGAEASEAGFEPVLPAYIRTVTADFDPTKIPVRDWVLGKRLLRSSVYELVGLPGTLKSMVSLCRAVAIATKRPITGEAVRIQGNTLVYDAEDSADEFKRRIAGVCRQHGVDPAELQGKLFYWSGHDHPLVIAKKDKGTDVVVPNKPEVDKLVDFIIAHNIVAVFLTPLRNLHQGKENSHDEMAAAVAVALDIASKGRCAVSLAHHSNKESARKADSGAGDMNTGSGAGAVSGAVRGVDTLTRIDPRKATEMSLPLDLIQMTAGKGNYAPHGRHSIWFEVRETEIGNGAPTDAIGFVAPGEDPSDTVGVPVVFNMAAKEREAAAAAVAKQNTLVGVIAAAMPAGTCSVTAVVPAVMKHDGCQEAKAYDLVKELVPETAEGITTHVGDRAWTLRRQKKGNYKNSPVQLIREWKLD